ncbi:hypothetical protein pb186bvf_015267 [Paramecium bursaria]
MVCTLVIILYKFLQIIFLILIEIMNELEQRQVFNKNFIHNFWNSNNHNHDSINNSTSYSGKPIKIIG